jgi:hypothetical protein
MAQPLALPQRIANFLAHTRRNLWTRETRSISANLGDRLRWELPRKGLWANAYLQWNGVLNLKNASTTLALNPLAVVPYDLAKNIRVVVNGGATPTEIPGRGLYWRELLTNSSVATDFLPTAAFAPRYLTTNPAFQWATAMSAGGTNNTISFCQEIPIGLNSTDPFLLLPLQFSDSQVFLELDVAQPSDLFSVIGAGDSVTFTGTVTLVVELMSIPNVEDVFNTALPELNKQHRFKYSRIPITAVGEMESRVDSGNTLLRVIERVVINGQPAPWGTVDKLGIWPNGGDKAWDIPYNFQLYMQRKAYRRDLPQGVHVFDFNAQEFPNHANARDWVDSSQLNELIFKYVINSGTALGQNNNYIERIAEEYTIIQ